MEHEICLQGVNRSSDNPIDVVANAFREQGFGVTVDDAINLVYATVQGLTKERTICAIKLSGNDPHARTHYRIAPVALFLTSHRLGKIERAASVIAESIGNHTRARRLQSDGKWRLEQRDRYLAT
jgi:hypothetical protein